MSSNSDCTLLITGASGKLGRRVIELLLEAKAGHIIAATRNPEKITDFEKRGVTLRHADFEEPDTLADVFTGVQRMLLISTDAIDKPGRRIAQHRNAVEAAARAGVQHVIYTSMPNPETSPVIFAPDHLGTEEAIKASGMTYTILRHNWYMDFLIPALRSAVATETLIAAAGDGGAAYVTREDCARTDAAALKSADVENKTLDVTGPEVVTFGMLAELAHDTTARPVRYTPVTPEERKQQFIASGTPPELAEIMVSSQIAMAEGKMGPVSTTVRDLTGRAPMSIAEFLSTRRDLLLG